MEKIISIRKLGSLNNILLFSSTLIIVLILVYYKYFYEDMSIRGLNKISLFIFLTFIICFSILFLSSKIVLSATEEYLNIRYFLFFKKSIPINQIKTIRVVYINALSDFFGIGFRGSSKYGTGIIAGDGMAVYVEYEEKKITISADNNISESFSIDDLKK